MHFLSVKQSGVPHGVQNVKIVKNLRIKVQFPQKSIYSTPIDSNRFWDRNCEPKKKFQPPEVICIFSAAKLKALKERQQKIAKSAPYFEKA